MEQALDHQEEAGWFLDAEDTRYYVDSNGVEFYPDDFLAWDGVVDVPHVTDEDGILYFATEKVERSVLEQLSNVDRFSDPALSVILTQEFASSGGSTEKSESTPTCSTSPSSQRSGSQEAAKSEKKRKQRSKREAKGKARTDTTGGRSKTRSRSPRPQQGETKQKRVRSRKLGTKEMPGVGSSSGTSSIPVRVKVSSRKNIGSQFMEEEGDASSSSCVSELTCSIVGTDSSQSARGRRSKSRPDHSARAPRRRPQSSPSQQKRADKGEPEQDQRSKPMRRRSNSATTLREDRRMARRRRQVDRLSQQGIVQQLQPDQAAVTSPLQDPEEITVDEAVAALPAPDVEDLPVIEQKKVRKPAIRRSFSFYEELASAAVTGFTKTASTAANVGLVTTQAAVGFPILVAGAAVGATVGVGKFAVDATMEVANTAVHVTASTLQRSRSANCLLGPLLNGRNKTPPPKKKKILSAKSSFNDDLASSSLSEAAGDDIACVPLERTTSAPIFTDMLPVEKRFTTALLA
ncbi:expressed unknown protein [Seminavis robusta]|uniref:Uncharacterized protein n=1 Tax=Seminavis robusta TaxID=568900 RepID=A0A9N8EP80_9STRA|nr:expressed unknown protein [Seminavis robusta]|eukprot:Sro1359_g266000.1 n/a (519) ;mRNA; f:21446-23002